jgi:hypothetical protein
MSEREGMPLRANRDWQEDLPCAMEQSAGSMDGPRLAPLGGARHVLMRQWAEK